jgi:hypothetical protein
MTAIITKKKTSACQPSARISHKTTNGARCPSTAKTVRAEIFGTKLAIKPQTKNAPNEIKYGIGLLYPL